VPVNGASAGASRSDRARNVRPPSPLPSKSSIDASMICSRESDSAGATPVRSTPPGCMSSSYRPFAYSKDGAPASVVTSTV
jgi:hypothetical protein